MKNLIQTIVVFLFVSLSLTSCYTYTFTVGKGPQTTEIIKEPNHYLFFGLGPMMVSDPSLMVGDTKNYAVTIERTFVDGLIAAITFGIYTPTTTTVQK